MLFSGVPGGSVIGPLLFNIYIFETSENINFTKYADGSAPYIYSSNIEKVLNNLQGALEKCFIGF